MSAILLKRTKQRGSNMPKFMKIAFILVIAVNILNVVLQISALFY